MNATDEEPLLQPHRRLLVLSPHLDDGVLSCTQWLLLHPGAVVMTVHAGDPAPGTALTDWDARCGFRSSQQAMQLRRCEDAAALAHLAAQPMWLELRDAQYPPRTDDAELSQRLGALSLWRDIEVLLFPLGLFHEDHIRLGDVMRALLRSTLRDTRLTAYAYEDVPYRRNGSVLHERLAQWHALGERLRPLERAVDSDSQGAGAKQCALQCYRSQLQGLGVRSLADALRPERCWRLEPSPDRP